jgi:hypothetical protein
LSITRKLCLRAICKRQYQKEGKRKECHDGVGFHGQPVPLWHVLYFKIKSPGRLGSLEQSYVGVGETLSEEYQEAMSMFVAMRLTGMS